jgi:hypothetical protein
VTETRTSTAWRPARYWWALLVVVVAVSLSVEFVLTIADPADETTSIATRVIRFFSYFTIQSNLLVLGAALLLIPRPGHDGGLWRVVRLASLLGITVTGLIYVVVLAPLNDPEGLRVWTNAGEHYVAPVLTVVGWLIFGPRPRITVGVVGWALSWPVVWIGYTLAHGAASGWYPYDFLDVSHLGYVVALRNLMFVVLVALGFLLLFWLVDRRLPVTGPRVLSGALDGGGVGGDQDEPVRAAR